VLTADHRRTLLSIARRSIEDALDGRRHELDPASLDECLTRPAGAFVTLHAKNGRLRGCIGSIEAVSPLCQVISSNAVNAAVRDPRFSPVRRDEIEGLHIEISVISPVVRVTDVAEIEVGRDGLIVRRGIWRGLLLPQVATDYGWDRETFLRQTCMKAGLPPDSWRAPECRIERFSAEVFGE
jgi:AmmeMemoRadiSam system protein A